MKVLQSIPCGVSACGNRFTVEASSIEVATLVLCGEARTLAAVEEPSPEDIILACEPCGLEAQEVWAVLTS